MLSFSLIFSAIEIESLNPNTGEAGSNLTVELVTSGLNFYDAYNDHSIVTGINFNPEGISVESYSIESNNSLTMNLNIDKIPATMFDVELVGTFYDQYNQDFDIVSKEEAFYVSSNNPLLVVDSPQNFGEVNIGGYYQIDAIAYNPSTVDIDIYGISMSNSDFTISQYPGLPAGETDSWPITFTPSSAGEQNNTMTIYSNDEFDPVQVFQMSGFGFAILGDINGDGGLNILDIVALIGYVFNDNTNPNADLNGDGTVNIVDVVMLVNLVLNA
tara:strand:- start:598 stop:1413 length:816 start_codon:yes stop_codon:yes gene_type:complete